MTRARPSRTTGPLVLACGPRPGGNTAFAASRTRDLLAGLGLSPRLARLAEYEVLACTGCQACAKTPDHACVLAARDQAEDLFSAIDAATSLFFFAPIYFYHLPAPFKALIDRSQRFFAAIQADAPPRPDRLAHVCLVAGRPRGDRLFDGSLLTLRYFLRPFGASLADPLLLMGLDGPNDLASSAQALSRLEAWADRAGRM